MTTITITEDFPKWEVEFHALSSKPKACSSKRGRGDENKKIAAVGDER